MPVEFFKKSKSLTHLDISSKVALAKLKLILNNNVLSSLGNLGAALLITLILSLHFNTFQSELILIWLGLMLIVSILRLLVGAHVIALFEEGEYEKVLEYKLFFPMIIAHAMVWACLPIIFIAPGELLINSFIAGTIAGISAGAVSSLSPVKRYFLTFSTIALIPTTFMFLTLGEIEGWLFGLLIFFFMGYMIRSGNMFSNTIENNMTLNLNNETLIEALKEQKEKALEGSRLKSEFLANMSHEIRTPMNGIIGFIQLLQINETDAEKQKYLETIDRSSQDLLRIINDILDFSKIESNQMQLEMAPTDLRTELRESVNLFEEKARKNFITIELTLNETLPNIINIDALRFRQIVHNLLSNAIKFSKPNSHVHLWADYDLSEEKVFLKIKDQGIGIAEEKLETIFEPFIQEDASVTRKYGGTGLGLAITHRLVNLMGGTISIFSEKDKGTEFEMSFPAPELHIEISQQNKDVSENTQFEGKILVVEDNPVNQMLLSKILESRGLNYELASDGLEALERFQTARYDLILMDISMPNLSGEEATLAIRDMEAQQALIRTPIVALTANAMQGDREKFLSYGMDEYLTKPIRIDAFNQMLLRFLSPKSH